jgi:CheY-like chemotaxis protein
MKIHQASLNGARLLLVEDNAINQELARDLLGRAGIVVTVVDDGQQAVDILSRESFDGVLMDCQMPVMDGYTATRLLRQQERLAGMPVIAMTANAMVGDREKAIAAGMNDHIGKPLKIDEMFATLVRWIHPQRDEKHPAGAAVAAGDPLDHLPGIDAATWRMSGMGDDVLYRRLLNMFGEQQQDFATGFRAAMDAGDVPTATRLAHTLKCVAGTLGAHAVERAAEALEEACQAGSDAPRLEPLLDEVSSQLTPVLAGLRTLTR